MATPAQAPNSDPTPVPVASPPLVSNSTSPSNQPTPDPPAQSPPTATPSPPPVTSPPPPSQPSPSTPPPNGTPPPPEGSSTPPEPVLSSPPPPSTPSVQPPQSSPSPPINSSPPPPASEPPDRSPPPPSPLSSSPPPPGSNPPTRSPPPPPASQRPPPAPQDNIPPPPMRSPPPPSSNSTLPPTLPSPPLVVSPPPPPQASGPGSNNPSQNNPTPSAPDGNGIGTGAIVGISIGVALVLLTLIGLVVCCLRRRGKRLSAVSGGHVMPSPLDSSPSSDSAFFRMQSSAPVSGKLSGSRTESESSGLGNSKALFTYEELAKATNGFSQENLLGEGGFGCVYKGILPDGRVVAVKQLKIGGGQGDREFKAEVETLSRIHHRHLVSIVGHCICNDRRLLIYDYVANNDLYFHLHGNPVLDWATRVKIAAGAARGLAYLHEDCHPRIIHRDIKSSNILLENNFVARVSDFGLAKLALDCNTHVTTRVMGTFGYMAPEYASSGKLTEKSDVFSFGVVLLELITGRKPVDTSQRLGDESLVEWARPLLSHAMETEEVDALADPKLGGNYVDFEMFRMIEAAAACVRHSSAKRPRMGQIVRAFENLVQEDLTNGMKPGESEIYNSAQQSAEIRLFRRMAFGSQNYSTDFFTHSSYSSRDENV